MSCVRYLSDKIKNILKYDISIINLRILMQNINYEDVKNYVKYNKESYQRIPLANDSKRSIYLLCWSPKQHSLVHDHPDSGCIFKVLKGNLHEITYQNENIETISLSVNDYAYRYGNKVLHKVVNSDDYAVTLHVYPTGYTPNYYSDFGTDCGIVSTYQDEDYFANT